MVGLIFFSLIIYMLGLIVCVFERCDDMDEALLWPLVFIKYMLKGLFKVVFTEWRN